MGFSKYCAGDEREEGGGWGSPQTRFTSPDVTERACHRYIRVFMTFSQYESFLLPPIVECFDGSKGWTGKHMMDKSQVFHLS